jgi:hypothetical protein
MLPEHLEKDPDALKLFERETKTIATLSYSNILDIGDSGADQEFGLTSRNNSLVRGSVATVALTPLLKPSFFFLGSSSLFTSQPFFSLFDDIYCQIFGQHLLITPHPILFHLA